jgi:phage shock protein A
MAQTRARVRDVIDPTADHFLYFSIYLLGAIAIFTLRLATSTPTFIVLIIPILLMGLYVHLVWKTERFRIREDRAADNIYYLGFLYTVTTLMVSLVRYQISDNPDVNSIIGDLGLGLITTVVGLLGRIFFGQLRIDPEEIEERSRADLSTAVEESRKQINNMAEEVSRVQSQAVQMMNDAKDLIEVTNNGVVTSIKSLENRIDGILVPENLITSKIEPALETLSASIISVSSRLDAIEITPNLINQRASELFSPLDGSIEGLGQSISNLDSDLQKISKHKSSLVKFAKSSEKLAESRERLINWFDEIAINQQKLEGINAGLNSAVQTLDSLGPAIESFTSKVSDQNDQYSKSVEAMSDSLVQARAQIEQMTADVKSLAEEFTSAMTALIRAANKDTRI